MLINSKQGNSVLAKVRIFQISRLGGCVFQLVMWRNWVIDIPDHIFSCFFIQPGWSNHIINPRNGFYLIQITCFALWFLTLSDNPVWFQQILIVLKHTKKRDINIFPKSSPSPWAPQLQLRVPPALPPDLCTYL